MSTVVYDYTPTTGQALTASGLNANNYQAAAGKSIYETTNGHLEAVNFDPSFQIRGYQVRPFQAGHALSVGRTPSNDYFSDLWMGDGVGYQPIAGCAITFWTEYACSAALFTAAAFVSGWRQFGADNGGWPNRLEAPDISVRTFFATGNTIRTLNHSQRDLPQTVYLNPASGAGEGRIHTVEQRLTRHYNLSHPRFVGGTSPCDQLLAGEHTFGLAVLVKRNLSGQDTSSAAERWQLSLNDGGAFNPDARPVSHYSAVQRARFYVRNVTAVRLL